MINNKPEKEVTPEKKTFYKQDNEFKDNDLEYNDPDFREKIKELDIIEEDIELLITQGTNATVERKIPFFNIEQNRYVLMPVTLSSISRGEMIKIEQEGKRNRKQNKGKPDSDTLLRVVAQGLKPKNKKKYTIQDLESMDNGTLKSLYDQINFISSTPIDGFTQLAVKQAFDGDS